MFKENFTRRHIGPNSSELNKILSTIGVTSVEQLLEQTIPEKIRLKNDLNLNYLSYETSESVGPLVTK